VIGDIESCLDFEFQRKQESGKNKHQRVKSDQHGERRKSL